MTDGLTQGGNEMISGEVANESLVGQAASAVEVAAPAAGETTNVVLTKGQTATLNFDATAATPVIEGNNFVLTFDSNGDGSADSRIVFQNLVAESQGADAPVLVIGGVELSAGLLIGQAQALVDGQTLETAAGAGAGPQGGGGSTYEDEFGDLIDGLTAQGGLEGTLAGLVVAAVGTDGTDPAQGVFTFAFATTNVVSFIEGGVEGDFVGGFEDWQANQHLGDATATDDPSTPDVDESISPMQIVFTFTPADNEIVDSVDILSLPEGVTLYVGGFEDSNIVFSSVPGSEVGSLPLNISGSDIGDVYLQGAEHSDADLTVTIQANISDPDSGETASLVFSATAIIDAAADKADLGFNEKALGGEESFEDVSFFSDDFSNLDNWSVYRGSNTSSVNGGEDSQLEGGESGDGVSVADFLGVTTDALNTAADNGDDESENFENGNGSAVQSTITVQAGQTLTFDFNFLNGEADDEALEFNDTAFIIINGEIFVLGQSASDSEDGVFTHTFAEAGKVEIGIAVFNEGDQIESSALILENLSLELEGVSLAEESLITIPVEATFPDFADDSETHTIVLNNVPADWELTNYLDIASEPIIDPENPGFVSYVFTVSGTDTTPDLVNEANGTLSLPVIFDPNDWSSDRLSNGVENQDGSVSIEVKAIATETDLSGEELTDLNNEAVTTDYFAVEIIEDVPVVNAIALNHDETNGVDSGSDDVAIVVPGAIEASFDNLNGDDTLRISAATRVINQEILGKPIGQAEYVFNYDLKTDGANDEVDNSDLANDNPATDAQENIEFDLSSINLVDPDSGLALTSASSPVTLHQDPDNTQVVWGLDDSGKVVFALHIDGDLNDGVNAGKITMVQYGPLDHPTQGDGAEGSHDEQISFTLTYKVTDDEGDFSTASVKVTIEDDGPVFEGPSNHNYITNGSFETTPNFGGWTTFDSIEGWTSPTGSIEVQHNGTVGNAQDGTVKVELDAHSNSEVAQTISGLNDGDAYELTFHYKPRVNNGDTDDMVVKWNGVEVVALTSTDASGWTKFTVKLIAGSGDNVLSFAGAGQSDGVGALLDNVSLIAVDLDEADVDPSTAVTGDLGIDFGADGPAADVSFDTAAYDAMGLTSGADDTPLTYSVSGNTLTASAGGDEIFTLSIDPVSGKYTFTLKGPLDHADGQDTNLINLKLPYVAADGDGDTVEAFAQVVIQDDIPVVLGAQDDINVSEEGLPGGVREFEFQPPFSIGREDAVTKVNGNIKVDFGTDGAKSIEFAGIDGATATFKSVGETVVYEWVAGPDGTGTLTAWTQPSTGTPVAVFTLEVTDAASGAYTFTQLAPVDHSAQGEDNLAIDLAFTVTDGDNDTATGALTVNVSDDTSTNNPNFIPFPNFILNIDEDGGRNNPGLPDSNSGGRGDNRFGAVSQTVSLVGAFGADGVGSLDFADLDGTAAPVTSGEHALTYSWVADAATNGGTLTASYVDAGGATVDVFTVVLNANTDQATFNLLEPIDHDRGRNENDEQFVLSFNRTDFDGDVVTESIVINIDDDTPVVQSRANAGTLDEEMLATVDDIMVSGDINVSFGADGGSFTNIQFKGWKDGDDRGGRVSTLKSGDVDVMFGTAAVLVDGGPLTLIGKANGVEVIRVEIDPETGAYKVILSGPVNNPDISYDSENPNIPRGETANDDFDPIRLRFEYTVTDGDGDKAKGNLDVTIEDDEINAHYTKTVNDLSEAKLATGDDVVSGTLSIDPSADGATVVELRFEDWKDSEHSGPYSNDLYSGKELIDFTQVPGLVGGMLVLEGTISGGVKIITLSVNPENGEYTVTLHGPVNHPDLSDNGSNSYDPISLYFGYKVVDGDGDEDYSTVRVKIEDSEQLAIADEVNVVAAEGDGTVDGNVLDNDDLGADGGLVSQVSFDGNDYDVPADGDLEVVGDNGILTISSDGSYSYEAFQNSDDNLIVNGSFEDTPSFGGGWTIFNSLPGWTSTAGIEVHKNGTVGATQDGERKLELDVHNNTEISQSLDGLDEGRGYELTFYYKPRAENGTDTDDMVVKWNGVEVQAVTSTDASGWTKFTIQLEAAAGSNVISFAGAGASNGIGALLDNVSLVAVDVTGSDEFGYETTDGDGDTSSSTLTVELAGLYVASGWNAPGEKSPTVDTEAFKTVTVRDYVEATVDYSGDDESIDLVVENAKRGDINLGDEDDDILITTSTNDAGASNHFDIDAGEGNDEVVIAGGEVRSGAPHTTTADITDGSLTTTLVDLGDGDDSFINTTLSIDNVDGGIGNDRISAGGGDDVLTGGADADTFVFSLAGVPASGGDGNDVINDFNAAEDVLHFTDVIDSGADGLDINDLNAMITDVTDHGVGNEVVVNFNNGSSIIFEHMGTAGSTIDSIDDLVNNPTSQIIID